MGNVFYRNRFWFYRSLYDDYMLREIRMSYIFSGIIYIPFYLWGIHINREIEVGNSHAVYELEYLPKRNRITEALLFEQFEMYLEQYKRLKPEIDKRYDQQKAIMGDSEELDDDNDDFDDDEDDDDDDED